MLPISVREFAKVATHFSIAREECLAETLLDRLGIPKTPVVADELAKEDLVVIPAGIMQNSDEEEDEGDLEPEEAAAPEKSGEDVGVR